MLDKAIRDLDRERMGLQNQEKKLVAEIKKTAKQGQMVMPLHASLSYCTVIGTRYVSFHLRARDTSGAKINAELDSPICCMQDAVKVMAKSLVRNRHAVTKMYGLKSQLQAVSLRIAVSILTLSSPSLNILSWLLVTKLCPASRSWH